MTSYKHLAFIEFVSFNGQIETVSGYMKDT